MTLQNDLIARPFISPGAPRRDLMNIDQAFGQLSVERLQNQEKLIDNVTLLFNGLQALQELAQSQATELLLVKEQLKIAEQQKLETAKIFEAYKKASDETTRALSASIVKLQREFIASEKRFVTHIHKYQGENQTSGPYLPLHEWKIS